MFLGVGEGDEPGVGSSREVALLATRRRKGLGCSQGRAGQMLAFVSMRLSVVPQPGSVLTFSLGSRNSLRLVQTLTKALPGTGVGFVLESRAVPNTSPMALCPCEPWKTGRWSLWVYVSHHRLFLT